MLVWGIRLLVTVKIWNWSFYIPHVVFLDQYHRLLRIVPSPCVRGNSFSQVYRFSFLEDAKNYISNAERSHRLPPPNGPLLEQRMVPS